MLTRTHTSTYSNKCFGELSKAQQVVRGSAGPLAEAHLAILHEVCAGAAGEGDTPIWVISGYVCSMCVAYFNLLLLLPLLLLLFPARAASGGGWT
jgi:hypothetical protein